MRLILISLCFCLLFYFSDAAGEFDALFGVGGGEGGGGGGDDGIINQLRSLFGSDSGGAGEHVGNEVEISSGPVLDTSLSDEGATHDDNTIPVTHDDNTAPLSHEDNTVTVEGPVFGGLSESLSDISSSEEHSGSEPLYPVTVGDTDYDSANEGMPSSSTGDSGAGGWYHSHDVHQEAEHGKDTVPVTEHLPDGSQPSESHEPLFGSSTDYEAPQAKVDTHPAPLPVYPPSKEEPVYAPVKETPVYPPSKEMPVYPPSKNAVPSYAPSKVAPGYDPIKEAPVYPPIKKAPVYPPSKVVPVYAPSKQALPKVKVTHKIALPALHKILHAPKQTPAKLPVLKVLPKHAPVAKVAPKKLYAVGATAKSIIPVHGPGYFPKAYTGYFPGADEFSYNAGYKQVYTKMPHVPPKPTSACPYGWLPYDGHCYLFSSDKTTWFSASMKCRYMGGYLAVVDNPAENSFIKLISHKHGLKKNVWFGLNDVLFNKIFMWEGGNKQCKLWDWGKGEPILKGLGYRHCAALGKDCDFQWVVNNCHERNYYICEFVPGKPCQCDN